MAQAAGVLVGDRTVIFYPDDFISHETLPSMALDHEPDSVGEVPEDWTIFADFFFLDGKNSASIHTEEGTDLYGTGEVKGDLKRNNTEVILWNTDNYGYWKDNGRRLYQSHPWILAVRSDGSSYGILSDHTWKQEFTLGNPIEIQSEGPPFRIIIIERDSPQEVLTALADLTGKIDLPPIWALGYHQCRYSYFPASQVIEIAETFREKEIPCDVIWMDIDYMDGFRVFTFDPSGFPDPSAVNNELHNLDFHSIWMIDPGIKSETGYDVFDSGTSGDHWVKSANGSTYNGEVWPGDCAFPDYTIPETREWWAGLYAPFMATGVDGVWNDMNEPAVFNVETGTMPEDNIHRGGGDLPQDVHLRYHNVYGLLMTKATRQGILQSNPDKRPFVLTRANFLGGHRYAATWTGDNQSSWEHMKMSVPMSLNLGLSGQPFSGPDIGGFIGDPGGELLAQWMALGAFYPFSRNHTSSDTGPQEPWAYGEEVEDISRLALNRRYRLLPYLYTLFRESSQNGLPVMRPLFFADPTDITLREEQEAFLWGDDLMIIPSWSECPAMPASNWRTIYLIDETLEADNYQPELKQRAGSIIPLAEVAQSTETYSSDSVTLFIAIDHNLEATGEMYADAGNGYDYQIGQYLQTNLTAVPTNDDSLLVSCLTSDGLLSARLRVYRAGLVTNYSIFYSDWTGDSIFKIPLQPDGYIQISAPLNGEEFVEGADILLEVNIEGDLAFNKVLYYKNENEFIGEALGPPWSFNWEDVPLGIYNLNAVGETGGGNVVVSDKISIQVGEFGEGVITHEIWSDIGSGAFISDLTTLPDYPDNPDERTELNKFEAVSSIGDEYGARIIGYVHPPATENYSFWISGDDYCELWLSSGMDEAEVQLIAEVPGWSDPGQWEKYPEQHSADILLEAGQKYFVMALHKEADGQDHLTVAWDYPSHSRHIIPGTFLSPYDFTTGIQETYNKPLSLEIHPNPAQGDVFVKNEFGNGHLTVYAANGQMVYEIEHDGEVIRLPAASFVNGIYMVRLESDKGWAIAVLVVSR